MMFNSRIRYVIRYNRLCTGTRALDEFVEPRLRRFEPDRFAVTSLKRILRSASSLAALDNIKINPRRGINIGRGVDHGG